MKVITKDFITARGMNSDKETVTMLHREAANILKAEEINTAYRIFLISGEEIIINEDELRYLRDLCQDSINNDFDIYYMDGEVTAAVA